MTKRFVCTTNLGQGRSNLRSHVPNILKMQLSRRIHCSWKLSSL